MLPVGIPANSIRSLLELYYAFFLDGAVETVFSGEMTGAWCTTDNAVGNDSSNGPTGVVLHMYLTL